MYGMPPKLGNIFLILWNTITEYFIVTYRILIDTAAITVVSFNSIGNTVLNLLYNIRRESFKLDLLTN